MKKAVRILFLSMIWTGIIWQQPLQAAAEILSVAVSGSSDLTVSWKEMPEAAAYHIYRSTEENGAYDCIYTANVGETSYTQTVSKGETYYYKVTAVLPDGESSFSESVSQFIPQKGKKKSAAAGKLGEKPRGGQYVGNWAKPDETYYYKAKGKLYAVRLQNKTLKVFKVSKSLKLTSVKTVKLKYDVWGGFYAGPDGNFYIALGYNNMSESKDKTVIKVIQYDHKWKKGRTANIKGGARNQFEGIYRPFEAGSCRMDMQGDTLYLATARQMFMHSDGLRHQSNISFQINTKTMKQESVRQAYASHSFNQFVRFKDGNLYLVNHGDAYPRSLELMVFLEYGSQSLSGGTYKESLFAFEGNTGDNFTGCKVGGMEVGRKNVLVCGTSQPHNNAVKGITGYGSGYKYNVFLSLANRKTKEVKVLWLTKYHPKKSSVIVGEARMVKLCDDRFAILYTTTEKGKTKLNYVVVSDTGEKIYAKKYSGMAFDGDSQPILYKGNIIWADDTLTPDYKIETKLYSIPAVY